MMRPHQSAAFFTLTVAFVAGCGTSYPETIDVTGTITLDGKPVSDALVTFMPADGQRSASGETDSSGRFTLTTYTRGDGAVPGKHNVAVYPKEVPPMGGDVTGPTGGGGTAQKSYSPPFPAKYGLPQQSGFTADVTPDDENDFTFDMKSSG